MLPKLYIRAVRVKALTKIKIRVSFKFWHLPNGRQVSADQRETKVEETYCSWHVTNSKSKSPIHEADFLTFI